MRNRVTPDALPVHAIAGSHVVLLGIDLPEQATQGLLGFSIERSDPTKGDATRSAE